MKRHFSKQLKNGIIYLICAAMLFSVALPVFAEPVGEQKTVPVPTESAQDGQESDGTEKAQDEQKSDETEKAQDEQKSDEKESPQSESNVQKDSVQNLNASSAPSAEEINAYFSGLEPNSTVKVADSGDYSKNLINGKTQVNVAEITDNIVLTTSNKSAIDEYYNSTASTKVLSALGKGSNAISAGKIYPGNMLTYDNNLATGMIRDETIRQNERSAGYFRSTLFSGNFFDIEDMSVGKAGPAIQREMYNKSKSTPQSFEFRVMAATSPLQLARGLNLTTDAVSEAVNNDQWNKIRTGEKKVVVVYAQQIFESLEFVWNDNNYAALFKEGTVVDVPKNAMLVTKVNYGRGYLLTVDLNMTGSPSETPVDLEGAVKLLLKSRSDWNEAQKNALKYASVSVKQIGYGNTTWGDPTVQKEVSRDPKVFRMEKIKITSLPDFITYLARADYKKDTKNPMSAFNQLVPLSYEAVAMGGVNRWMTLKIAADKYDFTVKKAAKIKNLSMVMRALGDTNGYTLWAYGIDPNFFNQTNEFGKIQYAGFNNGVPSFIGSITDQTIGKGAWNVEKFYQQGTDGCGSPKTVEYKENVFRWQGDVPAYKNIYGISFTLDKGTYLARGRAAIKTDGVIYNGYGLKFFSPFEKNDSGNQLEAYLRRCNLSNASFQTDFIHHGGIFYQNQNCLNIDLKKDSQIFDDGEYDRYTKIRKAAARNKPGSGYDGPECILSYIKDYEENGKNLEQVNKNGPKTEPQQVKVPDKSVVNPIKK